LKIIEDGKNLTDEQFLKLKLLETQLASYNYKVSVLLNNSKGLLTLSRKYRDGLEAWKITAIVLGTATVISVGVIIVQAIIINKKPQ
jgi:hypothetical protein